MDVLENTSRGTSGEKAQLGRILRYFRLRMRAPHPREPPSGSRDLRSLRVMFHNVTSGQNAPLERTLCNFRLGMRAPHPREPPSFTSGSPVGHVQWYILYYYYSKKQTRETIAHADAITSVTSGP